MFGRKSGQGTEPPSGPTESGGATPYGQMQWVQTELNRHSDTMQQQSEQLGAIKANLEQINDSLKKINENAEKTNQSISKVDSRLSRIIWTALGGVAVLAFLLSPYLKKLMEFLSIASGQGS